MRKSKVQIQRVHAENYDVYGARKVRRQLRRQLRRNSIEVARCTVKRLMRQLGLIGAVRGKARRATVLDLSGKLAPDLVKRQFKADVPNRLWVTDFTLRTACGNVSPAEYEISYCTTSKKNLLRLLRRYEPGLL